MEDHVEYTHECMYCAASCFNLEYHVCENQVGSGKQDEAALDLSNSSFKLSKKSLKGVLFLFEREINEDVCYVVDVFNTVKKDLVELLTTLIRKLHGITISFRLYCDMSEITFTVNHKNAVIGSGQWIRVTHENLIESAILRAAHYMILILNFYNEGESDWVISNISKLSVVIGELNPMPRGRAYLPIPHELKFRKGLVNLKDTKGMCFHLCIMAFLHGDDIWEKYKKEQEEKGRDMENGTTRFEKYRIHRAVFRLQEYLNKTNINFACLNTTGDKGVEIDGDMGVFEEINDISMTIYHHVGGGSVRPLRYPKFERKRHVDLLFLTENGKGHFVLIKDKSSFFGISGKYRHISCSQCDRQFIKQSAKDEHMITCQMGENAVQYLKPPQKNGQKFQNFAMTLEQPNVVYLEVHQQRLKLGNTITKTPLSYAFSVFEYGKMQGITYYDQEDIYTRLLKDLLEVSLSLIRKQKRNLPYKLSREEQVRHDNETHCFACGGPFTEEQPSCVNHDHYTSKYLNALHMHPCNPRVTLPKCVTLVAFNAYEIIEPLLKTGFNKKVIHSVNPISAPKRGIIGVKINSILRIIDAKNFTTDVSFKDFVRSTLQEDATFLNTGEFYTKEKGIPGCLNELLGHPPVYPSTHSVSSFLIHSNEVDTKDFYEVPEINERDAPLHLAAYKTIIKDLIIPTSSKYLETVTKLRMLMLGDAFSHLREFFFTVSKLDFLYSWTLNSFGFEEMLFSIKGREIEFLSDPGMREMASELVRGPISHITKRLTTSNSKDYGPFDPRLPESRLAGMDIRSCFLWTMTQDLPVSDYEWLAPEELASFNYKNPPINDIGYIFEVTMILPNEKHDELDQLPLFNEKVLYKIGKEGKPAVTQTARSLLHLGPKIKKCYHYMSIALMLELGYKLISVTRGFRFHQEPIMKDFALKYLHLRFKVKSKLYQSIMKLMVNVISGKCVADRLSYGTSEFCFTPGRARRLLAKDNFQDVTILSPNCALFTMNKRSGPEESLRLQGAVIYELSKIRLYSLFYKHLRPTFGSSMELIHSNTDSFIIKIQLHEEEYFQKLGSLSQVMDFSTLDENSKIGKKLYSEKNKNQPGFLRITHPEILEFAALRANCYSLLIKKNEDLLVEEMKISGTPAKAKVAIRHQNFKNAICSSEQTKVKLISTKNVGEQTLVTIGTRLVLSGLEVTRHWIDNFHSLSFGHFKMGIEALAPSMLRQKTGAKDKLFVKY